MNYVERLHASFQTQLRHPWSTDRSGGERVWFLVVDPDRIRSLLSHKEAFRQSTQEAGKRWHEYDLTNSFGLWMGRHRYASRYFARPERAGTLHADFAVWLAQDLAGIVEQEQLGSDSLIVLSGSESLYGITKLSGIIRAIEDVVPGRLLVIFPGQYSEPQYRLLDARDGWNYLAVPILPQSSQGRGN